MTKAVNTSTLENIKPAGGFRQAMAWLHTWAGLTLGWVLFFIFLTGTAGYFNTEIDLWMQPELPLAQTHLNTDDTAEVLLGRLKQEAPDAQRWFLALPVDRNQPYPRILWSGATIDAGASAINGSQQLDGITGENFAARSTGGGQWLYELHWRLHYLSRTHADVIVGFATLFMLVALITGVIIHKKIFKDFFTFRPRKGQRSWLDAHNILSVVSLPFHLMITYSGLIFMGLAYMPLIVTAHYGGEKGHSEFIAEVFNPPGLVEAADQSAPLISMSGLIAIAENRWGEGRIRSIDIRHPGDRNARVIFWENIDRSVFSSSERLIFDGVSGELLEQVPAITSPAKGARDLFTGLHEGLFATPTLRWLYFLSGLLGTAMIATGLVLWAVKRRQQTARKVGAPHLGLLLVEKLNVGTVVGLPIGIAAYFWANRLLPTDWPTRADWEAHTLFLTWLVMLVHASLKPVSRAWIEQLAIAALAFGLLPLVNLFTTDRHLGQSLPAGDWVFVGFDLAMLTLGLTFVLLALRLAHTTKRVNTEASARPSQAQNTLEEATE